MAQGLTTWTQTPAERRELWQYFLFFQNATLAHNFWQDCKMWKGKCYWMWCHWCKVKAKWVFFTIGWDIQYPLTLINHMIVFREPALIYNIYEEINYFWYMHHEVWKYYSTGVEIRHFSTVATNNMNTTCAALSPVKLVYYCRLEATRETYNQKLFDNNNYRYLFMFYFIYTVFVIVHWHSAEQQ